MPAVCSLQRVFDAVSDMDGAIINFFREVLPYGCVDNG